LENPTEDSVEIACDFMIEAGKVLSDLTPAGMIKIFIHKVLTLYLKDSKVFFMKEKLIEEFNIQLNIYLQFVKQNSKNILE
jgi:hypothetical protein